MELLEQVRRDPPHPGVTVRDDCLVDIDVDQAARLLDISPAGLERVMDGLAPVTPRLARRMEALGWSTATCWLRLQAHYDLVQERRRLSQTSLRTAVG